MVTLAAKVRNDFKKSALKKLRKDGEIPAVVYGSEINTRSISINRYFITAIKEVGRNSIFPLKIDGKVKNVILRDYQNEFITNEILHVDLLQVDNDTEIDIKISVVLTGTSIEEKSGRIVHQFLYELDPVFLI